MPPAEQTGSVSEFQECHSVNKVHFIALPSERNGFDMHGKMQKAGPIFYF